MVQAEMIGIRSAFERMADALEARNRHDGIGVQVPPSTPDQPDVEVSYADPQVIEEFDDITRRLTQARGAAPTEDEILEEYERRRQTSPPTGEVH